MQCAGKLTPVGLPQEISLPGRWFAHPGLKIETWGSHLYGVASEIHGARRWVGGTRTDDGPYCRIPCPVALRRGYFVDQFVGVTLATLGHDQHRS